MATNQILSFFKTHKKIVVFLLLFLGSFLLSWDIAFAEEADPVISEETTDKIIEILNYFMAGAATVLGLVTSFVTIFIYPGWTNGTMFGLLDYLKEIWILVSNVVYFVFAFILIAIAFMNIIGKGEGTWELKQALPKFIVWVLIVPFSWFFVQFILSISAILTVGVLTLPYDSFRDKDLYKAAIESESIGNLEICKDVAITLTGENPDASEYSSYTAADGSTISENLLCKNDSKVKVKDLLDPTTTTGLESSIFGITSIYTYGILKVHELDTIDARDLDAYKKLADLIFKILFDVLFVLVYMLLMIALFLALLVRGVRLWIYIMLSPFFGLLYFFGWGEKIVSKDKFSIWEFIALAMVPVYASAALAFGLAFILVASEWLKQEVLEGDDMDTLRAGWFSLSIYGAHWGTTDGEVEKSPLAKLILELFWVVILWIAVMAALKSSKTTEAIVQPIAKFGEDVWNLAAKAPTYAPILPASIGGSAAWLSAMWSSLTSAIDSHYRWQWNDRWADFARNILWDTTPASDLRNATARHEWWVERWDSGAIRSTMSELISRTTNENIRNQDFRRQFLRDLRNIFWGEIDERRARALETASNPEAFAQALSEILRNEWSREWFDTTRLTPIQWALWGTLGSMDAREVMRIFGIGEWTPDPAPDPDPTASPTDITINPTNVRNVTVDASWAVSNIDALRTEIWSENLTPANETRIRTLLRWLEDGDGNRVYDGNAIDAIIEALNLSDDE